MIKIRIKFIGTDEGEGYATFPNVSDVVIEEEKIEFCDRNRGGSLSFRLYDIYTLLLDEVEDE